MDAIIESVRAGNIIQLRYWLDNTENELNLGDDHKFSLLHWAARQGQIDCVELLIQRGARVNITNNGLDTPLHLAASHNHLNVVNLLIIKHADVNALNEHGNTPLHYACFWSHTEVARLLMEHEALVCIENKYQKTPLDMARPHLSEQLRQFAQQLGQPVDQRHGYQDAQLGGTLHNIRAARSIGTLSAAATGNNTLPMSPGATLLRPSSSNNASNLLLSAAGGGAGGVGASMMGLPGSAAPAVASSSVTAGLGGGPIDAKELNLVTMLNRNHAGEVWAGKFKDLPIVIRLLRMKNCLIRDKRDFINECKQLRICNHANILPVFGWVAMDLKLCVVSQLQQFSSLYQVLHQQSSPLTSPTSPLSDQHHQQQPIGSGFVSMLPFGYASDGGGAADDDVAGAAGVPVAGGGVFIPFEVGHAVRIARDISEGMQFLANLEPRLPVGFLLSSKHVLITDELSAKINMADFKFSFHEAGRQFLPQWMAPEALIRPPSDLNRDKADVWSFGVILWEMVRRVPPFDDVMSAASSAHQQQQQQQDGSASGEADYATAPPPSLMWLAFQMAYHRLRLNAEDFEEQDAPSQQDDAIATVMSRFNARMLRLARLCMQEEPHMRPDWSDLVLILNKAIGALENTIAGTMMTQQLPGGGGGVAGAGNTLFRNNYNNYASLMSAARSGSPQPKSQTQFLQVSAH